MVLYMICANTPAKGGLGLLEACLSPSEDSTLQCNLLRSNPSEQDVLLALGNRVTHAVQQ
jgi:hypothetical protein